MRASRFYVAPLLFAPLAAAGQGSSAQLPEGKGRDAVKKICSSCHEIGTVTGSRRTRIGWEQNVDDMVSRGAEGSDEDLQAVIDYLSKYFGKINVNTASAKDIETALDFSDQEARAIVEYREQNGKIKDFEQLKKVPGIDMEKLQAKRPQIAFSL